MRVLFCHDGPLRIDENDNYYGSAHNDKVFQRYYNIADNLSVLMRVNEISETEANAKLSKITISPLEIIRCPNLMTVKNLIFTSKKAKIIIERAVKKSDYIVARLPSMIGYQAINFAKKHNKPYLVEVVTCPWDAFWNHSLKGKIIAPIMYKKMKKYVKNAKYVVYVTNEFLQRRYPTKGKSENCSNVSLKKIDERILSNRVLRIKNMNNRKKIIGTTAAVNVKFKGQQYIIEALGKLKKEYGETDYEYQLVGDGDQSYLKRVAEKNNVSDQVVFLGAVPHNKVFDWLETIDIYAQPSRQEGLPRALVEAMSLGIPSFGAKTAGIPELLDSNYIFSNTKKNIDEIIIILQGFNKKQMLIQGIKNFNESKKYDNNIIEKRRSKFFESFKLSINS